MKELPRDRGFVNIRVAEYPEEVYKIDTITSKASPNILPMESQEELVRFLEIDHDSKTFILNDENGQPTGYLSYIDEPDAEGRVELFNLIVLPEYQGKGYGRQMVDHYHELMREKGHKKSKLVTSPDNDKAIGFYKKIGYVAEGVIKDYYGPGEDRLLMTFEL